MKIDQYTEAHPEMESFVELQLLMIIEAYGEDLYCEIATSPEESKVIYEKVTAKGLKFVDENAFGLLGTESCNASILIFRQKKQ